MSLLEKCYMRRHSQNIRVFSKRKLNSAEEDKIDESMNNSLRIIIVILCRNRERLLSQVFQRWKESTGVVHDYDSDLRIILLRKLGPNERRSELEIEVMFKWVLQNYSKDSTGLSYMLHSCKRKAFVVDALQQCRLEMYLPGETIVIQGDLPRVEDGVFTILSGSCEFILFDSDAMALLKLRSLPDKARHEVSKELLQLGKIINELKSPCGFGELASLSKVKRSTSVRAGSNSSLEFVIVPRKNVVSCFSKCRGSPVSEAVDFLRQASMGHKVSNSEILVGACAMTKRVLPIGTVMYYKGQPANKVFLVVNGEVLLDTDGCKPQKGAPLPFQNPDIEKCYCMYGHSILGDEGLCGVNKVYESTAAVISEFATIFEVSAAGKEFLLRRFELERYSALAYKDQMIQASPMKTLENVILLHSSFNNLRKAISVAHRDRGVKPTNAVVDESSEETEKYGAIESQEYSASDRVNISTAQTAYDTKLNKNCLRNAVRLRKLMQKRSLQELRVAAKDSILTDELFANEVEKTSKDNAKTIADADAKVQRALGAFYERRLLVKQMEKSVETVGLNIASHSMSMLMSAATNVMNQSDNNMASRSCDSSYSESVGSIRSLQTIDPTAKIRDHIRLLEEAKKSGAERCATMKQMEERLRLPIALPPGSLKIKSNSVLEASTGSDPGGAKILDRLFFRVSTRRSQKTQDYCEGLGLTTSVRKQVPSPKKEYEKATHLGHSSWVHPSTLFPESKTELLEVLREKWEIDPLRRAAVLASQSTPRYFKVSNNGHRCDPLESLETLLEKPKYSVTDFHFEASLEMKTSAGSKKSQNLTNLLKDVDSLAADAFLITTHRQERYESPRSSRAGTPAITTTASESRPTTTGSEIKDLPDTLQQYYERMKTPVGEYDIENNTEAEEDIIGGDEFSSMDLKHPADMRKRWGKIRTAVAISSALDPDRALKHYERALRLEPKTSKYLEGKRNSAGLSKYALAPVRHYSGDGSASSSMEVNLWKKETLQELFQTKNEAKRSVPVLSTCGAQAMYWEKQIVETVPKSGQIVSKRLSYHEVNAIRQNNDAQRYKRRLQRTKNNIL